MFSKLRRVSNSEQASNIKANPPSAETPQDRYMRLQKSVVASALDQGVEPHKCFQAVLALPRKDGGLERLPPSNVKPPPITDFPPDLVEDVKHLATQAESFGNDNYMEYVDSIYTTGGTTCDVPERWVAASLAGCSVALAKDYHEQKAAQFGALGVRGFTEPMTWKT